MRNPEAGPPYPDERNPTSPRVVIWETGDAPIELGNDHAMNLLEQLRKELGAAAAGPSNG
jgi:hypothetical protein